jgi:hypothetical protein
MDARRSKAAGRENVDAGVQNLVTFPGGGTGGISSEVVRIRS